MADTIIKKLSKPSVMRRQFQREVKKHFLIAAGLSVVLSAAYHFGITVPRKKQYEDYYATLDVDKRFSDIVRYGLFKSFNKDGTPRDTSWNK